MKSWPWGLLTGVSAFIAGCDSPAPLPGSLPIPPIDAAAPATVETATFALG